MPLMTGPRQLASFVRTPALLQAILKDVTQEEAMAATDGPDGWSVIEIVCHLRDFDGYFRGRCEMMLNEDNPRLPAYDHEAIAVERNYKGEKLGDALTAFLESRRSYVAFLSGLTEEQLDRPGVHPESGPITVLDQSLRAVLHDIDHTEQIARALGKVERFR